MDFTTKTFKIFVAEEIFFQTANRYNESTVLDNDRCHQSAQANFSPKSYRKNEPPERHDSVNSREMAEQFKRETELIDLTKVSNDNDLFMKSDIDFMNNYLKSLPDYSKMSQEQYSPKPARLREHPTPKPFYNAVNDYNARNARKSAMQQSPKNQRKQINPLSKSNSIHTFSKRNIAQSIEKETFVEDDQKNKISRSTSSTTIPVKEPSDLMGFMKKPSSLMNIFKKLGSQNPPNTQSKNASNNARKNVHEVSKTPSVSRTKNISDFWNENLQQQTSSNGKFGWNYQKIIPQQIQMQNEGQTQKPVTPQSLMKRMDPLEPMKPTTPKLCRRISSEVYDQIKPTTPKMSRKFSSEVSEQTKPTTPKLCRRISSEAFDQSKPTTPRLGRRISIEGIDHAKPTTPKLCRRISSEANEQSKPTTPKFCRRISSDVNSFQHHHHAHSQPFPKSQNQSFSNFVKKMTESPKLRRAMHNDFENEQKLLKSSSNSHIYMNQDDPNYFKNLHKITKSLENATNNIIGNNKSFYKRSISSTNVPCYLGTSPQQSHIFFSPNQPPMMLVHPSSAPINFYPPISYKPPQDFHMHQRSGSKSNIPLCYKYPLNKSSSNTSMMTNYNGTAIGFYGVQDPLLWQAATTPPSLHHINKSSSSSCIYAKTLSQPTHLSKNNDIFAKYKPIVSDDEESESEDDDESKHSNLSTSINKVPAPAPFKQPQPKQPQSSANNYPPFTKINSIQIPINGQLPSAFKSSNEAMTKTQQPDATRKNSITMNANCNSSCNKPLPMTSPSSSSSSAPIIKNSCNQSNNIFHNFMNPMAAMATQTQSINQMHLQQPIENVGSCYTPYTKYLSDRKYFDVAMSDGMNVSGSKPEQRRASKIPTLSEPQQQQQQQQKAKPASVIAEAKVDVIEENEALVAFSVPESNEIVEKEILSAFDPYFIDGDEPEPSTSNKLHQLLATVANEWNSSCDQPIATTPSNNCNSYDFQGDRYGSSQYEVVESVSLRFPMAWNCFLNKSLTISLINCAAGLF